MNQQDIASATVVTAKALILGDSGVGKSGLLHTLDGDIFKPTESTHGASISRLSVPYQDLGTDGKEDITAELELWDLAGQPDYNVFHMLFVPDATAVAIVIDEASEGIESSVRFWLDFVQRHCPRLQSKLLVSARVDRGYSQYSEAAIHDMLEELGFHWFFRTSAMTGYGIRELREGLLSAIDWEQLPRTTMPFRWRAVYRAIRGLVGRETALLSLGELCECIGTKVSREELWTIASLMHSKGEIFVGQPRSDNAFVLLEPSALNRYGASIVLAARTNARGPSAIEEAAVLRADIDLRGTDRLPVLEERLVLDWVVSALVDAGACYRDKGRLVFLDQSGGKTIKCFLSHNSADKPKAEELGRRLLDNGIDVWLDKWEILAGESITSRIADGIDEASAFIILMSRNSMKAKWVREELRIALQRRFEDPGFSLIPILLEECDIPAFLRDYVYVDWRSAEDETFEFLLNSLRGLRAKPQGDA